MSVHQSAEPGTGSTERDLPFRINMSRLRVPASSIGVGAAGAIVACVGYWFAVADRYEVFLYGHVDSPWYSAARPFDAITVSRYVMAPLVVAGAVSVVLVVLSLAARSLGSEQRGWLNDYARRPVKGGEAVWPWRSAWLAGAPVLMTLIPLVVMTQNAPTLPGPIAALVTLSALVGLGLALVPTAWAADDPARLGWAALEGLALIPILVLWRSVELPARGMLSPALALLMAGLGLAASLFAALLVRKLRRSAGHPAIGLGTQAAAAAWWLFLFAPLVHHLIFTPSSYRYITSAQNLLGFHAGTALVAWSIAGVILVISRK